MLRLIPPCQSLIKVSLTNQLITKKGSTLYPPRKRKGYAAKQDFLYPFPFFPSFKEMFSPHIH